MNDVLFLPVGDVAYMRINRKIGNISELVAAICAAGRYEGYCGDNWNALFDILRDLSWVPQKHIVLVHEEDILLAPDELEAYFFVLGECVEWWKNSDQHTFCAILPDALQEKYADFLQSNSD